MVHAALLLLMLEAANADLVPPSAWSAAPKISSALHAGRPITPSMRRKRPLKAWVRIAAKCHSRHFERPLSRPSAIFVTRLQPCRLPGRTARQLPDQSQLSGWNLPPL